MNPPLVPAPPTDWLKAAAVARRLGIKGKDLWRSELASGRTGIRTVRLGARGILHCAAVDVEAYARRLAQQPEGSAP